MVQDSYHMLLSKIIKNQSNVGSLIGGKVTSTQFLDELFSILFSGYLSESLLVSENDVNDQLFIFLTKWKKKIEPFLFYNLGETNTSLGNIDQLILDFRYTLPEIYDFLWEDANAAFEGDPAAESIKEVILAYSGFYAVAVHRIAHYFFKKQVPIFPRLLASVAHAKTGIDIHPGAEIGRAFFMDHGTGIVIGETTKIANNVKLYQGVTLGAISVDKNLAKVKRHPTIEESVVIYAGATILGGETTIGKNSIIGGNAWVTQSIPPFSIVYQKSEVRVRNSFDIESIDFTI
ncbi:MAG: serine O-acetyltransferase [Leptospira sp.]|nr:serine O-acetyltransferase [Leptospira sp.]